MRFTVRPVHGFALVSVTVAAGALAIANGCSGGGDSGISADDGGASSSGSSSSGAASSSSGTASGSSGGSSGGVGDAGIDSGPKPCKVPADCEDNSPCTTDECGLDGFCKYTVAGDGDGDGYASAVLGACGKDCDDGDPNVNPDSGWYETTRDAGALGGSFDWNCNGFAEPRWNTLWKGCNVSQGKCVGSGWATKIRGCGERGTYVNCFVSNGECASFDYPDSGQECR
jgi:hypothetical protein